MTISSVMNRISLSVALSIIIMTAACHKPQSAGSTKFTTSDTFVHVRNNQPIQVTLDLYKTQNDYNNNTNRYYSCLIPREGEFDIPISLIDTSFSYYYDLYSADYTFTNWAAGSFRTVKFGEFGQAFFDVPNFQFSGLRPTYLLGNNVSANWKAVNFYGPGFDAEWASLNDNKRYKVLTLYKSLNAVIYSKDSLGNITKDSVYDVITTGFPSGPECRLALDFITSIDYLFNCSSPDNAFYGTPIIAKDTILIQDNSGYWVMVPQ